MPTNKPKGVFADWIQTEKQLGEAKKAAEELGEDCEHETLGGCLVHGMPCIHEDDQRECPEYYPVGPSKERK